ncbi:MAG: 3-hexulose-6-phosphate synthase [Candidatus Asgardarchaeia archaeon]
MFSRKMGRFPVLQVALDFIEKEVALRVAEASVRRGADWIEAGKKKKKSLGISIVKELKETFPSKIIVADMKTMDTGKLETELAIKNGADIVSILGVADDNTIKDAIRVAHENNVRIMADLINCKNIEQRAVEIENLGADYILVHTGIDQQRRGLSPFDQLRKISSLIKIPIAVAGGLNENTVGEAIKMGAKIIIVGGAITRSDNPYMATIKIKEAIKKAAEL